MSDGIDDLSRRRPRPSGSSRRKRLTVAIAAVVIVLLLSFFRGAAVFYTDFLWFRSVGFTSVWAGVLGTKAMLAVVSMAFFFVVLWINIWVVDRNAPRNLVLGAEDEIARRYQDFLRPRVRLVRTAIALVIAVFAGAGFYSNWNSWLLFRNGGSFGVKDPQFGTDVGFFVFKLPFLTAVASWILYSLVLAVIVSLVGHYLQGAIRPQASSNRVTSAVKAHVSVLLGVMALVRAAQYGLDRYHLDFSNRGVRLGANYTDVHFLLPALGLLVFISLAAAVTFFVASQRRGWSLPVITVALWAAVSVLMGAVIPAGVQKFVVEPAESQKELKYIGRNIDSTQKAMGLDKIQVHDFNYNDSLDAQQLQDNSQTIRNVRLWDPTLIKPSYERLQETRTFYRFDDVDVDRYQLDNETTQALLSVRELNVDQLPQERRSWVNKHLQYTHGYGAVVSPANAVTSDGKPVFSVKDLPPTGAPKIDRPQVYFGEQTPPYSIVNSKQRELDYVNNEGRDVNSSYEGKGGVKLDSIVKKTAFAARVGELQPLISGLVSSDSRAMYLTNIRDRVRKAAPFLQYDYDPYPVLINGRISWIQDAYTTSDYYPYSQNADTSLVDQRSSLSGTQFNYIRNSVKIVTDAYDGSMKFYVMDKNDPMIRAYQKAFPKLFVDGSTMPNEVREHVRYPEDLYRVQSSLYGRYHLKNPADFYSLSDLWSIATKPEFGGVASQATTSTTAAAVAAPPMQTFNDSIEAQKRIEPYYLLMRLPNEAKESFLMFQPFVPFSSDDRRTEMSAFLTAKSDPGDYGKLDAYVMPRENVQVPGPALVQSRIQQEPTVKQQITLLNQSGSKVEFGNMVIVPIDNSLLYVRPLYVTAQQTQVPELKKVIVVQGNRIAMENTLQQALSSIFGSAPATREETGGNAPAASAAGGAAATPAPSSPSAPAANSGALTDQAKALLDQANNEFTQADAALRNGDLAGYQQHVQKGADLVKQARTAP